MKYKILKIQTQRCRNKRKRLNIFKFFICVFLYFIFDFWFYRMIGITLGDPAGIGPEITLKALFSVFGSSF
jgi:hypothetical protein